MQPTTKRWFAWVAAFAALAAVFVLYLRPDLAVTLGNQIWACF